MAGVNAACHFNAVNAGNRDAQSASRMRLRRIDSDRKLPLETAPGAFRCWIASVLPRRHPQALAKPPTQRFTCMTCHTLEAVSQMPRSFFADLEVTRKAAKLAPQVGDPSCCIAPKGRI